MSPAGAVGVYALAAILLLAGAWLLRAARRLGRAPEDEPAAPTPWGLSVTTLAVAGLSLMVLGYHGAAYATPPSWNLLSVPRDQWYVLAGGAVLAVGVSVLTDKMSARGGD
jgi:hypothetical protein